VVKCQKGTAARRVAALGHDRNDAAECAVRADTRSDAGDPWAGRLTLRRRTAHIVDLQGFGIESIDAVRARQAYLWNEDRAAVSVRRDTIEDQRVGIAIDQQRRERR
jgi:hypothetical protein